MNTKGFVLIELLVTISLLFIILLISFCNISMDFGYMDKMANEFVMDLRYIQMESMKYPGTDYVIEINKDLGRYYIKKDLKVEKTVDFKSGYIISYSNIGPISFNYEGTPINAGTFIIKNSKTEEIKSITIVPATGRTIIKE